MTDVFLFSLADGRSGCLSVAVLLTGIIFWVQHYPECSLSPDIIMVVTWDSCDMTVLASRLTDCSHVA